MDTKNFPPMADFYQTMQQFWDPQKVPPGFGLLTSPPLSLEELDKRITDLKSVEVWLNLNLHLLRTSIQSLEMQRSALSAFNQFSQPITPDTSTESPKPFNTETKEANTSSESSQTDIASLWWQMLNNQFEHIAKTAITASAPSPSSTSKNKGRKKSNTTEKQKPKTAK